MSTLGGIYKMATSFASAIVENAIVLADDIKDEDTLKVFDLSDADAAALAARISQSQAVRFINRSVELISGAPAATGSNERKVTWVVTKDENGITVSRRVKTPNPIVAQVTQVAGENVITSDKDSYQAMAQYFLLHYRDGSNVGGWTLQRAYVEE